MEPNNYRTVGSMHVCGPTNFFADVNTLLSVISRYKNLGGKVPPNIEVALELAKAGTNVEESLNLACDGLFKFYLAENLRCARDAGFSNLDQYEAERRSIPDSDRVFKQEVCIVNVERKWQQTNINYAINIRNPDSALRQFIQKTADQVQRIASKYIKKSAIKK